MTNDQLDALEALDEDLEHSMLLLEIDRFRITTLKEPHE